MVNIRQGIFCIMQNTRMTKLHEALTTRNSLLSVVQSSDVLISKVANHLHVFVS